MQSRMKSFPWAKWSSIFCLLRGECSLRSGRDGMETSVSGSPALDDDCRVLALRVKKPRDIVAGKFLRELLVKTFPIS